jgi:hypothetical protein
MDFYSPSENVTGTPCRPAGCPASQTTPTLLGFRCPTAQYQDGRSVGRPRIPPRPRTACGVWIPPARHAPPSLPASEDAGAPMGFTLQGVPLAAIGTPLGAHALLPLPGRIQASPKGSRSDRAGYRAFIPRRVRAAAGTTRAPAVDTFLGFAPPEHSPIRPGARFGSRRLPSHPWTA